MDLSLDDLLSEYRGQQDVLSTAVNNTLLDNTSQQQQQVYYYQPQLTKPNNAMPTLIKELNELKARVQKLEEQQQQDSIKPIKIPISIECMVNSKQDKPLEFTETLGVGAHCKNINNASSKRKKTK